MTSTMACRDRTSQWGMGQGRDGASGQGRSQLHSRLAHPPTHSPSDCPTSQCSRYRTWKALMSPGPTPSGSTLPWRSSSTKSGRLLEASRGRGNMRPCPPADLSCCLRVLATCHLPNVSSPCMQWMMRLKQGELLAQGPMASSTEHMKCLSWPAECCFGLLLRHQVSGNFFAKQAGVGLKALFIPQGQCSGLARVTRATLD